MPSDASDWSNRPAFRLAQDQISLVSAAELAAQLKAWQISLDTQVWLGEHSATVAELNRMLRAGAGWSDVERAFERAGRPELLESPDDPARASEAAPSTGEQAKPARPPSHMDDGWSLGRTIAGAVLLVLTWWIYHVADGAWWDRSGLVTLALGIAVLSMDRSWEAGPVWIGFLIAALAVAYTLQVWIGERGAFLMSSIWLAPVAAAAFLCHMSDRAVEGGVATILLIGTFEFFAGGLQAAWIAMGWPALAAGLVVLYMTGTMIFTPFNPGLGRKQGQGS